jgi:hypothetical protein
VNLASCPVPELNVNANILFHLVEIEFSDDLPAIIQLNYAEWLYNLHLKPLLRKLTVLLQVDQDLCLVFVNLTVYLQVAYVK